MAYKCNICGSVFESDNCPHCGSLLLIGDKMLTQLFPENAKLGPQCLLIVMENLIFLPDKTTFHGITLKQAVANTVEQIARSSISGNERIIPYQDIQKAEYPAADVKIGLLKRKGSRSIRIYRKSTGKYYDICFGKETDAQTVYQLLLENKCI